MAAPTPFNAWKPVRAGTPGPRPQKAEPRMKAQSCTCPGTCCRACRRGVHRRQQPDEDQQVGLAHPPDVGGRGPEIVPQGRKRRGDTADPRRLTIKEARPEAQAPAHVEVIVMTVNQRPCRSGSSSPARRTLGRSVRAIRYVHGEQVLVWGCFWRSCRAPQVRPQAPSLPWHETATRWRATIPAPTRATRTRRPEETHGKGDAAAAAASRPGKRQSPCSTPLKVGTLAV